MMTWQAAGRGGLMVFGHIHNNTNAAYWPLIRASPHMLNVAKFHGTARVSMGQKKCYYEDSTQRGK